MKTNFYALRQFVLKVSRMRDPIICPLCQDEILPKHYAKHCASVHKMKPRIECIWCQGEVKWNSGEKHKYVRHLERCLNNLIKLSTKCDVPVEERPAPTTHTLMDMTHKYPEKDFFGHGRCLWYSYEFMKSIRLDPPLLTVQDDNVNLAIAWLRLYIETEEDFECFHVMVRLVAMDSFRNVMKQHPEARILPFACWCDGGPQFREAQYRQHAHMIVYAPKRYFLTDVWPHVNTEDRANEHYKCKLCIPIESRQHLVNMMGYTCKRESKCIFSSKRRGNEERENHFYFNKTLPVDFKIILALQWDGGLLEYLDEKYRNISKTELGSSPIENIDGRWKLKIGDLPRIRLDSIGPVTRNFVPTSEPTDYEWSLIGGKKLYFKKLDAPLPLEDWIRCQMKGGNALFHAIANEWWTPKPYLQAFLNAMDRLKDHKYEKIVELESKEREMKETLGSKDREIVELKNEIIELKNENSGLKEQLELKDREMKNRELEWKDKIIEWKDREIDRLKSQINELKRKLETFEAGPSKKICVSF